MNGFKVLIKNKDIQNKAKELANCLDNKFGDENIVLICVLKGSFMFFSEILHYLKSKNVEIDFISVKSYNGTQSSGEVKFVKDTSLDLKGKNIVFIEDIIDTGLTAKFLFDTFKTRGGKSLSMVSLLQKPSKLAVQLDFPIYVGFEIKNEFVVGFGLDLDEKYRAEKNIWILKK